MPVLKDFEEYAMEEGLAKGRVEGREEGLEKGIVMGQIQFLQELLGLPVSPIEDLSSKPLQELHSLEADLKARFKRSQ